MGLLLEWQCCICLVAGIEFNGNKIIHSDKKNSSKPSVTVAIPALNEEDYIADVLDVFIENKYENIVQIFVADGGSKDRTREIVSEYASQDSRVQLIDNPDKYQSFALNRILEVAEGELFLRADAHCIYDSDYVIESVKAIKKSKALNVGGTQRYIAKNLVQSGIAISSKNFFGNGGAKYMDETFEGYADTVFLGCFETNALKEIGSFSEINITNEDAEINLRLRKVLNGKIYVSPKIKTWYYPRSNLFSLFKQYFRYGRGRQITNKKHEGDIPYRSKAPFFFLTLMFFYGILDLVILSQELGFIYVSTAILVLVLVESFRFSKEKKNYFDEEIWKGKEKNKPSISSIGFFCFTSLLIINLAHFLGYSWQLIKNTFRKQNHW